MTIVMNAQEVAAIIPNRYPILFIDYVDVLEDSKIIATKNVTINEAVFQGHFPGNPTFPGVLILESLAQAGSILILTRPNFKGKMAYIGGIDKAKFRQKVIPGDVMKLHFEITKFKGKIGIAHAAAFVEDKKVAECEFTFIVDEKAQQK